MGRIMRAVAGEEVIRLEQEGLMRKVLHCTPPHSLLSSTSGKGGVRKTSGLAWGPQAEVAP